MGFFSDLKEDLAQAVNELTEDTTEKELLEEEERLKKELAEMQDEFQVSGVDETEEYEHFMAKEAIYEPSEVDEILRAEAEGFAGVNEDVMATLAAGYADATENLPEEEDALAEELEAALEGLDISDEELNELIEHNTDSDDDTLQNEDSVDTAEEENFGEVEEIEEIEEVMEMAQEEMTAVPEVQEEVFVSMADENAEVGIIPAGMMITGDIATAGGLDLRGTVLGNIEIGGKLNVSGSIQGNSKAVEIFAQAAKITGDIECDNSVKIGPNSVVIGNVSARSAVIAGAVKGDIDVRGPVILDSSAIIKGNIKSKSVQINNGAAVEGMCSQCYADVNPTSFFEGLE
ncbi:MAG: polymer-forming cytoskeletal protein [Lachnospiraceae bacterium]|nr:polymer-forming cytoskeletal protein [Lachnospiraceae bacterium]